MKVVLTAMRFQRPGFAAVGKLDDGFPTCLVYFELLAGRALFIRSSASSHKDTPDIEYNLEYIVRLK